MTLRYIYGQDRNVAHFVAQLIPHIDPAGFPVIAGAIGIVDGNNHPLAGIVYYNWNTRAGTVDIAAAARPSARHWVSRETLFRALDHAFTALGCQMVVMRVVANNDSLLRQMKAFGCKLTLLERMYGRADDGIICTYTVEQWTASKFNRPPVARQSEAA
jgi:RimJ/RimL family protein N-acetyltransferase